MVDPKKLPAALKAKAVRWDPEPWCDALPRNLGALVTHLAARGAPVP